MIPIKVSAEALLNVFQEILRFENSIYSRLNKAVFIPKNNIPIVVVFIPLPVEPGDAPINIKTAQNKTVAPVKFLRGIVLKPAERKEVE